MNTTHHGVSATEDPTPDSVNQEFSAGSEYAQTTASSPSPRGTTPPRAFPSSQQDMLHLLAGVQTDLAKLHYVLDEARDSMIAVQGKVNKIIDILRDRSSCYLPVPSPTWPAAPLEANHVYLDYEPQPYALGFNDHVEHLTHDSTWMSHDDHTTVGDLKVQQQPSTVQDLAEQNLPAGEPPQPWHDRTIDYNLTKGGCSRTPRVAKRHFDEVEH